MEKVFLLPMRPLNPEGPAIAARFSDRLCVGGTALRASTGPVLLSIMRSDTRLQQNGSRQQLGRMDENQLQDAMEMRHTHAKIPGPIVLYSLPFIRKANGVPTDHEARLL